jgi:hypothetical protein
MSAELISPFAGLSMAMPIDEAVGERPPAELESPFEVGVGAELGGRSDGQAAELLDQLADEDFDDALEALVDEAAAQHLVEAGSWTARPSGAEAKLALTQWIEPLAAASERSVDRLADRLADVDLLTMGARELNELLDSVEPEQLGVEGFDNFLGGFLGKVKNAVGGLVRKGLNVAGKLLPVGMLLDKLKAMVRPLLDRLLGKALNLLPESVRPIARTLAAKLGIAQSEQLDADPVTRLSEDLDLEIVGLLHGEGGGRLEPELEDEGGDGRAGAVASLDAARERLATELTEVPAGTAPVAELERFIPAVMAAGPLIKLAVSTVGRDRIVRFLADRIAGLIKGMVGPEAAGTIARPLADVGLRTLGFEVPAAEQEGAAQALAAEALASTVEGTVLRTLELPAEAFADELQLDAAVQQAFAEAAAAAMPDRVLRADLPERETSQEGGVWVLMPRPARPAYRYRRYSHVFVVPVTRQLARVVPWSDRGTLESHLLDAGAEHWPVQAEVELYEAMPGTHLGHLGVDPAEVQSLTPEVAGLLLGEPGLGRRLPPGASGTRPAPGRRFYHVRAKTLRDHRTGRPRRRLVVRLDVTSATPSVRVVLRLSERKAQQLLDRLDATPRDLPGALAALRRHYTDALPDVVVQRLLRRSLVPDAARARAVADRIGAGVTAALSAFLTDRVAQLTTAVRDPANGVTIAVTFPGVSRAALDAPLPSGQVTVAPGWGRHG